MHEALKENTHTHTDTQTHTRIQLKDILTRWHVGSSAAKLLSDRENGNWTLQLSCLEMEYRNLDGEIPSPNSSTNHKAFKLFNMACGVTVLLFFSKPVQFNKLYVYYNLQQDFQFSSQQLVPSFAISYGHFRYLYLSVTNRKITCLY